MAAVSDFVPFARPSVGAAEEEAVLRVLRSGWLTTGSEAGAFEAEFRRFLDPDDEQDIRCLAVNSATSALHLALVAAGVGPGDVVITTSYTFASTAEVAVHVGADVAFADLAPGSFLIDPASAESIVRRLAAGLPAYPARDGAGPGFGPRGRPAALVPVHFGGLPCDMEPLVALADTYGMVLIEDAAHSFPSPLRPAAAAADDGGPDGTSGPGSASDEVAQGGKPKRADTDRTIGGGSGSSPSRPGASPRYAGVPRRNGDFGCFSFYATKTITTGEGGMVVVKGQSAADRVSLMRNHGIDRPVWNRYTDRKASWRYEVAEAGFKYNLPDLLAALGRAQLARAMELLDQRRAIAAAYDEAFGALPYLTVPGNAPSDAKHLYPLRLDSRRLERDVVAAALQEEGIGISVHFIPLHTMPYWKRRYGLQDRDLPRAFETFRSELSLPIWPGMDDAAIRRVVGALRTVCGRLDAMPEAVLGSSPSGESVGSNGGGRP